jgi:hypothetical protein
MTDPNTVTLPPGVQPLRLCDVPHGLAEAVGILMRRHHHGADSTCDWCLKTAREVLAATINLIKATPDRDDPVAAFIRRHRDLHAQQDEVGTAAFGAVDDLLDAYRLHADTGRPLTEPTPDAGHFRDGGPERIEAVPVRVPGLSDTDQVWLRTNVYGVAYLSYLGADGDAPADFSDVSLNRSVAAHHYALSRVARHAYGIAQHRSRGDAAQALLTFRDLNHFPSRFDDGACCCGEPLDDEGLSTGCAQWQALTEAARDIHHSGENLPLSVLHRAVEGFGRSGEIIDPDAFGEALAELGDKLVDEFQAYRAAFHAGKVHRMAYPLPVLDKAMAVLSALTAALNQPRTPTAAEVVDREGSEQRTPAGDPLRVHLVSEHWVPDGLGMTDEEADRFHRYVHAGRIKVVGGSPHHLDHLDFDAEMAVTVVAAIDPSDGGDTWRNLMRQHMARLLGQDFDDDDQAPGTLYDESAAPLHTRVSAGRNDKVAEEAAEDGAGDG